MRQIKFLLTAVGLSIIILYTVAGVLWLSREHKHVEPVVVKDNRTKEPLVCGIHPDYQWYVANYEYDKNYIIDNDNGGIWESTHCVPYKGQADCNEGHGNDCEKDN